MIDCETFRRRLLEDPAASDAALTAHSERCATCAAFAARVRSAERTIEAALKFDVAATRAAGAGSGDSPPPRTPAFRIAVGGLAAALVVAAVALYAVLGRGPEDLTTTELAAAVMNHWDHDAEGWLPTRQEVAAETLREVLAGDARIDAENLEPITFARSCYLFGRWVPHLSVRGRDGPVMVVLIPGRRLEEPVPLELAEYGLAGRIVPAGDGSIAILGSETEAFDPLERDLVAAVEWTPPR